MHHEKAFDSSVRSFFGRFTFGMCDFRPGEWYEGKVPGLWC